MNKQENENKLNLPETESSTPKKTWVQPHIEELDILSGGTPVTEGPLGGSFS